MRSALEERVGRRASEAALGDEARLRLRQQARNLRSATEHLTVNGEEEKERRRHFLFSQFQADVLEPEDVRRPCPGAKRYNLFSLLFILLSFVLSTLTFFSPHSL